jgi:uncharacterized damage-inducible protein DinB
MGDWFTGVDDTVVKRKYYYKNLAGREFYQPFDLLLTHIFNHNTYHNGQLVTMLRALAVESIRNGFRRMV